MFVEAVIFCGGCQFCGGSQYLRKLSVFVETIGVCGGSQCLWRLSVFVEAVSICGGCQCLWRLSVFVEAHSVCGGCQCCVGFQSIEGVSVYEMFRKAICICEEFVEIEIMRNTNEFCLFGTVKNQCM